MSNSRVCLIINVKQFEYLWQGSKFYEHELRKDQQVNKRIEKILKQKSKITDQQIMKAQLQVLSNSFWERWTIQGERGGRSSQRCSPQLCAFLFKWFAKIIRPQS